MEGFSETASRTVRRSETFHPPPLHPRHLLKLSHHHFRLHVSEIFQFSYANDLVVIASGWHVNIEDMRMSPANDLPQYDVWRQVSGISDESPAVQLSFWLHLDQHITNHVILEILRDNYGGRLLHEKPEAGFKSPAPGKY